LEEAKNHAKVENFFGNNCPIRYRIYMEDDKACISIQKAELKKSLTNRIGSFLTRYRQELSNYNRFAKGLPQQVGHIFKEYTSNLQKSQEDFRKLENMFNNMTDENLEELENLFNEVTKESENIKKEYNNAVQRYNEIKQEEEAQKRESLIIKQNEQAKKQQPNNDSKPAINGNQLSNLENYNNYIINSNLAFQREQEVRAAQIELIKISIESLGGLALTIIEQQQEKKYKEQLRLLEVEYERNKIIQEQKIRQENERKERIKDDNILRQNLVKNVCNRSKKLQDFDDETKIGYCILFKRVQFSDSAETTMPIEVKKYSDDTIKLQEIQNKILVKENFKVILLSILNSEFPVFLGRSINN
jgi:hypothetical protein